MWYLRPTPFLELDCERLVYFKLTLSAMLRCSESGLRRVAEITQLAKALVLCQPRLH
jgi:hypothetical protein